MVPINQCEPLCLDSKQKTKRRKVSEPEDPLADLMGHILGSGLRPRDERAGGPVGYGISTVSGSAPGLPQMRFSPSLIRKNHLIARRNRAIPDS